MALSVQDFYRSSNGDRWQLVRDPEPGGRLSGTSPISPRAGGSPRPRSKSFSTGPGPARKTSPCGLCWRNRALNADRVVLSHRDGDGLRRRWWCKPDGSSNLFSSARLTPGSSLGLAQGLLLSTLRLFKAGQSLGIPAFAGMTEYGNAPERLVVRRNHRIPYWRGICAMMLDARGDQHRSECRRP